MDNHNRHAGYDRPQNTRGQLVVPQRRRVVDSLSYGVQQPAVVSKPAEEPVTPVVVREPEVIAPSEIPVVRPIHAAAPAAQQIHRSLSRTARKADVLDRSATTASEAVSKKQTKKRPAKRFFTWRRTLLNAAILLVILGTGYVTFDSWWVDHQAQQQLNPLKTTASALSQTEANEGKDTTPLPADALTNYKVAADLPRILTISKIGVQARVLQMGVNDDGTMQAPTNIYDTGWYTGSAKPGETGATVIDGHASQTGTHYGEFGKLDELVNGDIITLEKGDGTKLNYKVVHTETDALNAVDMNKLMTPYGNATQGLNLITCAGDWTKDGKTLDHRVLIFAVPVTSN